METKDILNLKIDNSDFEDDLTIRGYLNLLLSTIWREGEGFSGKRPFGNSGWEYDLYTPLVKAGVVRGEMDEWSCIEDVDEKEANRIIIECIDACFEA